jgi:hypothetical protein
VVWSRRLAPALVAPPHIFLTNSDTADLPAHEQVAPVKSAEGSITQLVVVAAA